MTALLNPIDFEQIILDAATNRRGDPCLVHGTRAHAGEAHLPGNVMVGSWLA